MIDLLSKPWPWYVAGPLIGLVVPLLLFIGNKRFGVSSSFRHTCAALLPGKVEYLRYNWRRESWNLYFVVGMMLGAFIAAHLFPNPPSEAISTNTIRDLARFGVTDIRGLVPSQLFSWSSLMSWKGFLVIVVGGFLVGFGTRYADGCTSGHSIMGLANFEKSSLVATIMFFIGGMIVTYIVYPLFF